MRKTFHRTAMRLMIPLLILTLACSTLTTTTPSTTETEYRFDDLPTQGTESSAIAEYQAISQWNTLDLTYYFINGTGKISGDTERDLVRQAFAMWAAQTPLTFTETTNENEANIVLAWATGEHGDGDPFDGPGDVLAHASFPNPYDDRQVFLHFDDDERWVNSDARDVDLLTVAAHEIGHTLGLAHSNDPDALMFPSYDGPRRFLGNDDIAGIQELYGVDSDPKPAPDVPENEVPPAADGEDADQDGISDQDEVLVTGTDPQNSDSDKDGLGDGVEVENRMNPLDGDMDKDGRSDGQEVDAGTDPFFPEQSDVAPELEEDVSEFLTNAIELEIEAYREGDASIAAPVMAGNVLADLENTIADLNQQGLVIISELDYYQSYIHDIRVLSNTQLEVDTCEYWTNTTYRLSDGEPVSNEGPELVPQTITIEQLDSSWYITNVEFFDAPAFCTN
jgi:hypothetical protein